MENIGTEDRKKESAEARSRWKKYEKTYWEEKEKHPALRDTEKEFAFFLEMFHKETSYSSFFIMNKEDGGDRLFSHGYRSIEKVPLYYGKQSIYMSINEFNKGSRRKENCTKIRALFFDLDCHIEGQNIEQSKNHAYQTLCHAVSEAFLPKPTLITDSGRGFGIFYVLQEGMPIHLLDTTMTDSDRKKKALYDCTYENLANMLDYICQESTRCRGFSLELDRSTVKDVSRVCRVPGSWNPKAGTFCKIIAYDQDAFWTMSDLFNAIPKKYRIETVEEDFKKKQKKAAAAKTAKTEKKEPNPLRVPETRFKIVEKIIEVKTRNPRTPLKEIAAEAGTTERFVKRVTSFARLIIDEHMWSRTEPESWEMAFRISAEREDPPFRCNGAFAFRRMRFLEDLAKLRDYDLDGCRHNFFYEYATALSKFLDDKEEVGKRMIEMNNKLKEPLSLTELNESFILVQERFRFMTTNQTVINRLRLTKEEQDQLYFHANGKDGKKDDWVSKMADRREEYRQKKNNAVRQTILSGGTPAEAAKASGYSKEHVQDMVREDPELYAVWTKNPRNRSRKKIIQNNCETIINNSQKTDENHRSSDPANNNKKCTVFSLEEREVLKDKDVVVDTVYSPAPDTDHLSMESSKKSSLIDHKRLPSCGEELIAFPGCSRLSKDLQEDDFFECSGDDFFESLYDKKTNLLPKDPKPKAAWKNLPIIHNAQSESYKAQAKQFLFDRYTFSDSNAPVRVMKLDPAMPLYPWIRKQLRFMGKKISCHTEFPELLDWYIESEFEYEEPARRITDYATVVCEDRFTVVTRRVLPCAMVSYHGTYFSVPYKVSSVEKDHYLPHVHIAIDRYFECIHIFSERDGKKNEYLCSHPFHLHGKNPKYVLDPEHFFLDYKDADCHMPAVEPVLDTILENAGLPGYYLARLLFAFSDTEWTGRAEIFHLSCAVLSAKRYSASKICYDAVKTLQADPKIFSVKYKREDFFHKLFQDLKAASKNPFLQMSGLRNETCLDKKKSAKRKVSNHFPFLRHTTVSTWKEYQKTCSVKKRN